MKSKMGEKQVSFRSRESAEGRVPHAGIVLASSQRGQFGAIGPEHGVSGQSLASLARQCGQEVVGAFGAGDDPNASAEQQQRCGPRRTAIASIPVAVSRITSHSQIDQYTNSITN
ncbi:hypothetical protein K2X85_06895 [bacterium]|nr:hypothetical protein [bacterium]